MSWQIIHDDDVAATESWREALLDVREEDGAVHRSINHEWSDLPFSEGHEPVHGFEATREAAMQSFAKSWFRD